MTDSRSWKFRYLRKGAHVHVDVFAGLHADATHAKCGDLVMTPEEFADLQNKLVVYSSVTFYEAE
jgi:hypothetical protein